MTSPPTGSEAGADTDAGAPRRASTPGAVAEDYVRLLLKREERGERRIATQDIAAALGVTSSTVSTTLRRLAEQGLVEHEPYHRLELTDAGRALAVAMARRHRLIETFLHERLGYGWDEVHDEAEALEHAVSDRFIDALDDLLDHPSHDPHGDPIPSREGRYDAAPATRLPDVAPGARARIVRVDDDDPVLLRWLAGHGLVLGTTLQVEEPPIRGEVYAVRCVRVGAEAAAAVEVPAIEVPAVVARAVLVRLDV